MTTHKISVHIRKETAQSQFNPVAVWGGGLPLER